MFYAIAKYYFKCEVKMSALLFIFVCMIAGLWILIGSLWSAIKFAFFLFTIAAVIGFFRAIAGGSENHHSHHSKHHRHNSVGKILKSSAGLFALGLFQGNGTIRYVYKRIFDQ
jgi:hypothetical protein